MKQTSSQSRLNPWVNVTIGLGIVALISGGVIRDDSPSALAQPVGNILSLAVLILMITVAKIAATNDYRRESAWVKARNLSIAVSVLAWLWLFILPR